MERSNLRKRKMLATRNALALTAANEVLRSGIPSLHAEEIAAAVGVSTRTFHNYFPTRGHAVAYHVKQILEQWGQYLSEVPLSIPSTDAVFDNLGIQFEVCGTRRTLYDAVELSSSLGLLGQGARYKIMTDLLRDVAGRLASRFPEGHGEEGFTDERYFYLIMTAWETIEHALMNAYSREHTAEVYYPLLESTSQVVKKAFSKILETDRSDDSTGDGAYTTSVTAPISS